MLLLRRLGQDLDGVAGHAFGVLFEGGRAGAGAVGAEARLLGDHQADQEAEEALRGGPGVAVAVGGVAVAPRR